VRWSLSVGISKSSGIFFKPQKSIILKRFSADSNKPIKTHCPSSFQQIRTTSGNRYPAYVDKYRGTGMEQNKGKGKGKFGKGKNNNAEFFANGKGGAAAQQQSAPAATNGVQLNATGNTAAAPTGAAVASGAQHTGVGKGNGKTLLPNGEKGSCSATSKSGNHFIDNPNVPESEKTVLMVRNIPCRLTPLAIMNLLLSNYVIMADKDYRSELNQIGFRFGSQEDVDTADRQQDLATADLACKVGEVLPGVWSRYNLHPRDFQYRLDPFVLNAISFFHVPKAGESSKNLGYCFIAFRSATLARRFWQILEGRRISASSVKTLLRRCLVHWFVTAR
jgi:hypothetical protein